MNHQAPSVARGFFSRLLATTDLGGGITSVKISGNNVLALTTAGVLLGKEGGFNTNWLTLTTGNPVGSARERLVVMAELVEGPSLEYVLAAA